MNRMRCGPGFTDDHRHRRPAGARNVRRPEGGPSARSTRSAHRPPGTSTTVGFTIRQHGVRPVNPEGTVGIGIESDVRGQAVLRRDTEWRAGPLRRTGEVPRARLLPVDDPPGMVRTPGPRSHRDRRARCRGAGGNDGRRRGFRHVVPRTALGAGAPAGARARARGVRDRRDGAGAPPAVAGPGRTVTLAAGLAGVAAVLLLGAGAMGWQQEAAPVRAASPSGAGRSTVPCCSGPRGARPATSDRTPSRGLRAAGSVRRDDVGRGDGGPGSTAEEYLRESIRDPELFAAPGIRSPRMGR